MRGVVNLQCPLCAHWGPTEFDGGWRAEGCFRWYPTLESASTDGTGTFICPMCERILLLKAHWRRDDFEPLPEAGERAWKEYRGPRSFGPLGTRDPYVAEEPAPNDPRDYPFLE